MANIVITTQPVGATDVLGDVDTILTVVPAADQGTVTYQWKSGTTNVVEDLEDIVGATTDSYTIPTDSVIGTVYYACLLGTDAVLDDTLTDVVAMIVVEASITITVQPANETVAGDAEPSERSVTATYDGIDAVAYQWYTCTDLLKTGAAVVTDATLATYTPPNTLLRGSNYFYFCRLTAADADTVDTAVITVYRNGLLPVPEGNYFTGAYVLDYIAQCSAEVQLSFTTACARSGIEFPDTTAALRSAQLSLFMSVI